MAKALARADELSGLPKGTLKDTRAKLDEWSRKQNPRAHAAHKKQMARTANGYIENAPLEILLRTALRRIMQQRKKKQATERKRAQRSRQKR